MIILWNIAQIFIAYAIIGWLIGGKEGVYK